MNNVNPSEFNEHLLQKRLGRVSVEVLERFLGDLKNIQDISKDKKNLTSEIVKYYKVMKGNAEFMLKFGDFIRDYVLGAGESEYLIEIPDKKIFIEWVNGWNENTFKGKNFNFYKNIHLELGEKYLDLDEGADKVPSTSISDSVSAGENNKKQLSFPSQVFLLVAYSRDFKSVFSKDKLVDIHDTFEFEIIFRENTQLVSVRGNSRVVGDFFSSALQGENNSFSMIQSLFVGDFDRKKSRPIAKPRKSIDIEELRKALGGQYLDIDAPISGDQATRIRIALKGMQDVREETHPVFGPALAEAWKEQEKSRIGFCYNGNSHSFSVTSNGGLYFRQFAPEEVITYVLLKISNL
jgi:hypothetical protein